MGLRVSGQTLLNSKPNLGLRVSSSSERINTTKKKNIGENKKGNFIYAQKLKIINLYHLLPYGSNQWKPIWSKEKLCYISKRVISIEIFKERSKRGLCRITWWWRREESDIIGTASVWSSTPSFSIKVRFRWKFEEKFAIISNNLKYNRKWKWKKFGIGKSDVETN